jgi:hypothetical protein
VKAAEVGGGRQEWARKITVESGSNAAFPYHKNTM